MRLSYSTDLQVSRATLVLLEIALLSPEDVESMRTEIRAALESEGDWNRRLCLKCGRSTHSWQVLWVGVL